MTESLPAVRWTGAVAVATLPAEVDLLNSEQALDGLLSLLRQKPGLLVIDMTQTSFCDSAGAAVLIHTYRTAASASIPVRLAASADVTRTLTLLAINRLMSISPTVAAALEGVPDGSPQPHMEADGGPARPAPGLH